MIAQAHFEKEKNAKNLKSNPKRLRERVLQIVSDLNLPNEELGLNHLKRIEEYLDEYSIVCYRGGDRSLKPIYFNSSSIRSKFLYILHHEDHFNAVLKIRALFKCKYFCHPCLKKIY